MAFTEAQKTLMHEALGLFQGTTFDWYDYNDWVTGTITSVPIHEQIDFSTATTRLTTIIAAIEAGGDGREVRIGEILTEYSAVSFDTARISVGGGGGASGARYDPEDQRARILEMLQKHLGIRVVERTGITRPFSGGGPGGSIGVSR